MDGTGQTRKKLEKLGIEAWARLAWLTKNINLSEVFQLFVYAALEIKLLFFVLVRVLKKSPLLEDRGHGLEKTALFLVGGQEDYLNALGCLLTSHRSIIRLVYGGHLDQKMASDGRGSLQIVSCSAVFTSHVLISHLDLTEST
jgi:hypothetical protein